MIDPIVQVALVVSGVQLLQFLITRKDTKELKEGLKEVVHATNSIVEQGKIDSEKIGNLKGHAAAMQEEKERTT